MQRHLDFAAGRDLRQLISGLGQDGLSSLLQVVVALADRLPDRVLLVAPEPR